MIGRDKYDKIISDLVRERDQWTCQRCHRYFPEGRGRMGLHNGHLFTRRSRSTRYDPDACISWCYGCHQYLDSHPKDKELFAIEHMGEARYRIVDEKHRKVRKWKPWEKEEMYAHYRAELRRLQAMRADGVTDYIEIVAYD